MTATPPGESRRIEQVYRFPQGIPAFEQHRQFRLIESAEFAPLVILESECAARVRFVCAPARALMPGFEFELTAEEADVLGTGGGGAGLLVYVILTFREGAAPTANLMAPVVLNPATGVGLQSVQAGSAYSHIHPLERG